MYRIHENRPVQMTPPSRQTKAWLQKQLTQLESEETHLRQRKPHFSAPTAANFPATGNFWQPLTQGRVWGKALRAPTEDAPARNVGAKPNTKFTTPTPRPTPNTPDAPPPTPKPKGKGSKKPPQSLRSHPRQSGP